MKHLKTYQLFESTESEVKDYIEDIFQELEDEGFDIKVSVSYFRTFNVRKLGYENTEEHSGYQVKINKRSKTFLLEDIYDYILTCKSYLKEMGFFITEIGGNVPANDRQERYGLDHSIDLHESDPEKYKLFDKPLIKLEFLIRKEK